MRIKKMYQGTVPENKILDTYSDSATDTYSCNYVNGLETYSTDETRVGTWIDGKPIYRKVLNLGSIYWNSTPKNFTHGISNLDICIKIKWFGFLPTVNKWYLNWDAINTKNITVNETNIEINNTASDATFSKNYIILEYTKTTDV